MSDLARFTVSIENTLFEKLEKLSAESGYRSRSEFIRDLIRDHLVDQEWKTNEILLGTISLVYNHHSHGLGEQLTHLQHDFKGTVLATTHVHLDHHLCAEMIMVRGRGKEIKSLVDMMQREKGVLHARLAMGTTGKVLM